MIGDIKFWLAKHVADVLAFAGVIVTVVIYVAASAVLALVWVAASASYRAIASRFGQRKKPAGGK